MKDGAVEEEVDDMQEVRGSDPLVRAVKLHILVVNCGEIL